MKGLLTPSTLASLLALLATVRGLPGAVVELGVYQGATLKALAEAAPERMCFGFDTFNGQPAESWRPGDYHQPGEFGDTSLDAVWKEMPVNVLLVPGVFPRSAGLAIPLIAFAHVDFDLEQSTVDAIGWLQPRMVPGGLIVFDDYRWRNCPGVAKAIERCGLAVKQSNVHQCYWTAQPATEPA